VAAALAEAKRERIEAGAPAEAWAGIVVLGDGDLVPVPGGRHRLTGPASWLLLAALVIAGVVVHFLTSSRREGVRKRTD
jgi:hypothetical protein